MFAAASCAAMRLLIVEDHPIYLEGLRYILEDLHSNLELMYAESAADATAYLAKERHIDLVILDLSIPDGGGLSVLNYIESQNLFVPAVVLSATEDPSDVQRVMNAGASGFISKASGRQEILSGLRTVMSGEQTLPSFFSKYSAAQSRVPDLTPRQKQVLKLVCDGLPNKRICQELGLSEHTVKSHMKALFALLNVHNRTECMRVALEWRLLED
jgi:DNA-binding NarL/FixJ family response regulator